MRYHWRRWGKNIYKCIIYELFQLLIKQKSMTWAMISDAIICPLNLAAFSLKSVVIIWLDSRTQIAHIKKGQGKSRNGHWTGLPVPKMCPWTQNPMRCKSHCPSPGKNTINENKTHQNFHSSSFFKIYLRA